MKVFRLILRVAAALIFLYSLFVVAWVGHKTLLRDAATWWVVSDDLDETADAIVVLGGGFETRLGAAAELYKRGLGKLVLVVNPQNGQPEKSPTLQDRTFTKIHELGVPAASIVNLKDGVASTYEEARSVLGWVRISRARTVIVPTDLFHTRRVSWIFAKELKAADASVKVQAIKQPNYSSDNWWQHKDGRDAFLSEIIKYLFYRVKY